MRKFLIPLFIAGAFFSTSVVSAISPPNPQDTNNPTNSDTNVVTKINNPFKCPSGGTNCGLEDLFNAIIDKIILPIGSILAVLAFIWAGFLFVTAGGDEKKISTAKLALLYAVIGTLVLLGAKAISLVLTNTVKELQ